MNDSSNAALESLPPLREVVAAFGLSARRSLGQHFLLDLNLTRRIANAASEIDKGTIVEVGPGPGGLTRSLLTAGAARVVAIERDERCIEALGDLQEAADGRLTLIAGDALDVDVTSLGPPPLCVVANLPYNVATPLLLRWLSQGPAISELVLMFQLEVAERITASPGGKTYGRLSVISNWCADTRLLFRIPARAFTPPPKVDSAIVRLTPHQTRAYPGAWKDVEAVTAAAFGQRRKTLRRSLASLGVPVADLLSAAEIDGGQRAEQLSVAEFARLAASFNALRANL